MIIADYCTCLNRCISSYQIENGLSRSKLYIMTHQILGVTSYPFEQSTMNVCCYTRIQKC